MYYYQQNIDQLSYISFIIIGSAWIGINSILAGSRQRQLAINSSFSITNIEHEILSDRHEYLEK